MKAIQDLLVICVLLAAIACALRLSNAFDRYRVQDIDAEDQVETTCEQTSVQYVRYIQDVQNELPTYREE